MNDPPEVPLAERWANDPYTPAILTEPEGGPIPRWTSEGDDVEMADESYIGTPPVDDPIAAALQAQWLQARQELLDGWPATAQDMVDELADQAEAALHDDDPGKVGQLAASARVVSAMALVMDGKGSKLAKQAAADVVAEAADQGVKLSPIGFPGAKRVTATAQATADMIASGYALGASRITLQLAGSDPAEVRDAVAEHLAEMSDSDNGFVGERVGALLSAAQHAGRLAVIEEYPADSYTAAEVNDKRRCGPCSKVNGTRYNTLAKALVDYPHAGLKSCQGRDRCRGYIRPNWTT